MSLATLARAMAAFVQSGGDRTKMNVPAWAATYPPATGEDVRRAWEQAATEHSMKPSNTYGAGEESGK